MGKRRKRQSIEPKPTQYGNTLFRSRLEARWAVFLDFCGNVLNWEYEPREFKLPNGWTYTPDFKVVFSGKPSLYLEVKPYQPHDNYLNNLVRFINRHKFRLLIGVGDFYKPDLLATGIVRPYSNRVAACLLMDFFTDVPRAAYTASHFRFDLE